MKRSTAILLAAGLLLGGFSRCSSTTETADTAVTTETVTPERSATPPPATTDSMTSSGAASGTLTDDPSNFVLLAGSLDLLQTRSSNQAISKASNPDVRKFAQEVIEDHSNTLRELRGLAASKSLKYPDVLLPKHQLMLNRLSEEKPKDFDKTYMELQEAAHKELEELFEDASKRHSDPEMKEFATRNLEILRKNLETSRKVKDIVD